MKLEQLVALDAIVSTGTFRGAAEQLNKSQSAISNAIRLLEEELDIQMFSRAAYRPSLTPEGDVFYRQALRVLQQMRELKKTAGRLSAHEEAELRLAVSSTLPLHPILAALKDIGQVYPATHIRVATESMGGPVARLMEGQADIAIASLADVALDKVDTHPVAEVTIRPLATPDFAAELGTQAMTPASLQGRVQVVVAGTGGQQFDQSRDLLAGGNKWTVSDFASKKEVILSGLGWGGLPDHLTVDERKTGRLVPLSVNSFPPRHTVLHAIRRKDVVSGIVANTLWDKLTGLDSTSDAQV